MVRKSVKRENIFRDLTIKLSNLPGRFYFKLFWGSGKEHRDKKRQRVTLNLQHPTESYSHSRFTSMGLHRNWMCECLWKIGKESLMTADMDIQNFI